MGVTTVYNRYNASTGEYMRMPEPAEERRRAIYPAPPPQDTRDEHRDEHEHEREAPPERSRPDVHSPSRHGGNASAPARKPGRGDSGSSPALGLERILSGLGGSVSRSLGSLDAEDMLLLAVVYLMYRGSGDKQLLIVLAALLLS